MFPDKDRAKSIYEYLRRPTEKKSIMNQFDEYLMNTLTPSTYPTNTKQFVGQVIESAPDLYNNMKMLLKIHTKPSVLYKDFLARPLVNKINKKQESRDCLMVMTIIPQYPIPSYKDGGIHIKKKNRGKFNALKKRTGKSTEELTHSKNPLTRKRAIFAQNAKKWKHKGRK